MAILNIDGRGRRRVGGKRLILSGKNRVAMGSEEVETVPLPHKALQDPPSLSLANDRGRTRCRDSSEVDVC